jgi:hypothetical protein
LLQERSTLTVTHPALHHLQKQLQETEGEYAARLAAAEEQLQRQVQEAEQRVGLAQEALQLEVAQREAAEQEAAASADKVRSSRPCATSLRAQGCAGNAAGGGPAAATSAAAAAAWCLHPLGCCDVSSDAPFVEA